MSLRSHHVANFTMLACIITIAFAINAETIKSNISYEQLQAAYARHFAEIRKKLLPHSALPPLLDLTKMKIDESGEDRRWEKRYTLVHKGELIDPGVDAWGATSTGTTYTDTVGRPDALPARSCEGVIIGQPVSSDVRIYPHSQFVYSRFSVQISRVLKGKKKPGIRDGAIITTVQLGGSVKFPSGHLATFIEAGSGFIALNKQYVLFIWRPPKSSQTYMVAEAYVIENGRVFPVHKKADVSAYESGMPLDQFEAKVKSAIRKDIDTN